VAAQDIIVVVTPEPTSITDAYALMKVLSTKYAEKHFKVLMNAVSSETDAKEAFRRLSVVAERFLNISIDYLGHILYDASFSQAVRQQKALLELYPSSVAARCFHRLARQVLATPRMAHPKGNIQFFWQQLLTRQPAQVF
jgi:flagellar biosynthesis protein FlhG